MLRKAMQTVGVLNPLCSAKSDEMKVCEIGAYPERW